VSDARFDWRGNTTPFVDCGGGPPAHFVLEQTDDDEFEIQGSFCYEQPGGTRLEVSKATLPDTDFASIPFFLSWLVSRHGRHTPAVLLHDMLITSTTPPDQRVKADLLLRDALDQCHVPPVRSRLMWAGVALGTRCTMGLWGIAGIVGWGILVLAGTVLLAVGIASANALAIGIALVGPFVGALLWGRQYWAGVIAGYAVWLVAAPAIATLIGYSAYWLVEQAVRLLRKLLPRNQGKPLPGPPTYKAS
jgi:hypothetical protein